MLVGWEGTSARTQLRLGCDIHAGCADAIPLGAKWNAGHDSFVAGKEYTFPFSTFQTDGSDLSGLAFVAAQQPRKFESEIDQLEIK
jgi:hypothetical protein